MQVPQAWPKGTVVVIGLTVQVLNSGDRVKVTTSVGPRAFKLAAGAAVVGAAASSAVRVVRMRLELSCILSF